MVIDESIRRPMSWKEYAALPTRPCTEYVDGLAVVSPSPTGRHQDVALALANLIQPGLPTGAKVRLEWAWKPGADEFIPDVIVFDAHGESARYTDIPHLVIEVLSGDRSADLVRKLAKYAEAGLDRYWVVDPDGPELFVFERVSGGLFAPPRRLGPDDEAELDIGCGRVVVRPGDLVD